MIPGPPKTLHPDAYDTIEMMAYVNGGIGGGRLWRKGKPCCIYGMILAATPLLADAALLYRALIGSLDFNLTPLDSLTDRAVIRYNAGKNRPKYARIPFQAWCRELGIVRGNVTISRANRT